WRVCGIIAADKNMIEKLKEIIRHRQLILILVSRELKARYRGTMFGFLWSLFNPLLLMLVYTVVFGFIVSRGRVAGFASTEFYALFMFNGILPWTWFSSSLIESSNVLMVHGALIKKIKFPIEVLPIMVVATNMVHFILALPVLILFFLIFGKPLTLWVLFLPISLLVQFVFTMGLCFLISALTVHFRDIKDILSNLLTLWFFATPIIYTYESIPKALKMVLNFNPMTHLVESYHFAFYYGSLPHWRRLSVTVLVGLLFFYLGYLVFDKLRDTFVEEV
ncbi:MAG: ABC transporter permease, partial [Chrysiogenales bacterium]